MLVHFIQVLHKSYSTLKQRSETMLKELDIILQLEFGMATTRSGLDGLNGVGKII